MIFNGTIHLDQKRAVERINFFIEKGKSFELKEKKERRSIRQNAYLHLILSWFAIEYGETLEYVKLEIFKVIVNPLSFKTERANPKTGEIRDHWRSTSELDTGELTLCIDRFRDYASKEAGIYLPEPKDLIHLAEIEKQIEQYKQYL